MKTNWRIPALLAFADHILILALAFRGYAAWTWLDTPWPCRMTAYVRGWWQSVGTHPGVILCGIGWHAAVLTAASSAFAPGQAVWMWPVFWAVPFFTVLPVLRFVAETGKHDYGQPTVSPSSDHPSQQAPERRAPATRRPALAS